MSYPPPYPHPPVGYQPSYSFWPQYFLPPEQLLAPARRAGVLLIVLASIMLFPVVSLLCAWLDQDYEPA